MAPSTATSPAVVPAHGEGVRTQARLVALNELLEVNCALMVDRLVGLRGVEAFTASRPPAANGASWLGHIYTDANGEQWQELDLQALSSQPRFLSIGA